MSEKKCKDVVEFNLWVDYFNHWVLRGQSATEAAREADRAIEALRERKP